MRKGDLDAAEALLAKHQAMVYTVALRLLADAPEAQDVAQEALMRAYTHLCELRDDAGFLAWLRRITVNRSLNVLRRRRAHPTIANEDEDDDMPTSDDEDPSVLVVRAESVQRLGALLDVLPEAQRVALVLHDVYDYSVAEIGELQHCGISAIKMRLSRARAALRKRLLGDGEGAVGANVGKSRRGP